MKIFNDVNPKKTTKKYSRRKRKGEAPDGKAKLQKLHPMAFSLLAMKAQEERANKWIVDTFFIVNNNPERLSEKWLNRINCWTEELVKGILLDEPNVCEGKRACLGPFKIMKIIPAKITAEYPMPAIMAVDEDGWKWYFKTSKAHQFSEGDAITFTATVSAHKEGITFLKRASKIICVDEMVIKDLDKIKLFS